MERDRAVATVLDVGLALLLIGAAVALIGTTLYGEPTPGEQPESAERTATTLVSSTITIEYDRSAVRESSAWVEPEGVADDDFVQTDYGPAGVLLADAAVANAHYDDTLVLEYGPALEDAVSASSSDILTGVTNNYYLLARWEPYTNSTVQGSVTAGFAPPPDRDLRQAELTISSGIDSINETAVASEYAAVATRSGNDYEDGYGVIAEAIAAEIVEGQFPPRTTQTALESQNVNRAMKVYHYQRAASALGVADEFDPESEGNPISRRGNASAANEILVDALADELEDDIAGTELERRLAEEYDDHAATEEELARATAPVLETEVHVETVTITVDTWRS